MNDTPRNNLTTSSDITEKSQAGTKDRESTNAKQRLYDRSRPEYSQAKGHNQRVKERYPDAWAKSTITNETLAEWVVTNRMLACPYCSDPVKEIDHKHPLSKGGEHSFENLQMLCLDCNRSKHDMTDEEFKSFRAKEPKRRKGLTLADYGIDYSVLKDKMGRFRTRSLFKEMWKANPNLEEPPLFSLKLEDDKDGLISLKRIYLETCDPTEYRFAVGLFKDPRHWQRLCVLDWFSPFVERWRWELRAKLRAQAVDNLIKLSEDNLQAIKALATEEYVYQTYLQEAQPKKRVGRPNKEKPDNSPSEETLADDAARIGLK
jgi:5-methylcytosine-specific restriction endonuclease McrA